eukprot:403364776
MRNQVKNAQPHQIKLSQSFTQSRLTENLRNKARQTLQELESDQFNVTSSLNDNDNLNKQSIKIPLSKSNEDEDKLNSDLSTRKQMVIDYYKAVDQSKSPNYNPTVKQSNADTSNPQKQTIDFPLQNIRNILYWGTLKVGNPPVELKVDFDTGSTNMWIVKTCSSQENSNDEGCYDSQNSHTAVQLEQASHITFGKGQLTGPWGQDSIWIGDQYELKNQHMAFAQISDAFVDGTGILLGLGYPQMAAYGFTPFFDHIMESGILPKNIFSFSLSSSSDIPSHLILGEIDNNQFEGDLKYYPVVDKQFWTINLNDVLVGNKSLGICQPMRQCYVAIDSGTSFLTFPQELYDQVQDQFPHNVPCSSDQQYQDITYVFEDRTKYTIPADKYIKKYKSTTNIEQQESQQEFTCDTVISPLNLVSYTQKQIFLLGDVFMQQYYTVFDRDQDRIGIAKAKIDGIIQTQQNQ